MENDHKFITRKFKHSLNVVFYLISEKMRFPVRNSFANDEMKPGRNEDELRDESLSDSIDCGHNCGR